MSKTGLFRHKIDYKKPNRELAIPHLHRVSPDGQWLAAYDPLGRVLSLWRLTDKGIESRQRIRVHKITGILHTFRWLSDSRAVVFQTSHGLRLVGLDLERNQVRAKSTLLFDTDSTLQGTDRLIVDFRVVTGGVIAHVQTRTKLGSRSSGKSSKSNALLDARLYHIAIGDKVIIRDLTPAGYRLHQGGAVTGGRIAMLVTPENGQEPSQMWLYQTHGQKPPTVISKTLCRQCANPMNWAAGDQVFAFGTRSEGVYRVRDKPGKELKIHQLPNTRIGNSAIRPRILWINQQGDRILGANKGMLLMWNHKGKLLWKWNTPRSLVWQRAGYRRLRNIYEPSWGNDSYEPKAGMIRSAHFESDGRTVVVAIDRVLFRLRRGKIRAIMSVRRSRSSWTRKPNERQIVAALLTHHRRDIFEYIENIIPLPDGSMAFNLVREDRVPNDTKGPFVGP